MLLLGRCRRRARHRRGEAAVRHGRMAQEQVGEFPQPARQPDRGGGTSANAEQLPEARLDLADFYGAHGMYEEAHGVANLSLSEARAAAKRRPW